MDIIDYADGGAVQIGSSVFRCLYPLCDTKLLSTFYALQMGAEGQNVDGQIASEKLSRQNANTDSSVWMLEHSGEQIALFLADAPITTLQTVFKHGPLSPKLVKPSYHGLADGHFSTDNTAKGIQSFLLAMPLQPHAVLRFFYF